MSRSDHPGGKSGVIEMPPATGGDIQILGSGTVAVDTATLRQTAARFVGAEDDLATLARRLASLQHLLVEHDTGGRDAVGSTWTLQVRLNDAIGEAEAIAHRLREAAAVYELVELNAAHQAAFLVFDGAECDRIDLLRERLMAQYPDANGDAALAAFGRAIMWPSELVRQATETGLSVGGLMDPRAGIIAGVGLGSAAIAFGTITGTSGSGLVARDARLAGGPASVTLRRVTPGSTSAAAPSSLVDAAARIPGGGDARVRVERYTMPDGTRQFAVYVAGTQTKIHEIGGDDPWDNASNVQLYSGRESASYTATMEALRAAGAEEGDVVHAVGYSQGAMIASHLAVESGYDVRTLVTFGPPVEADVSSSTLSVGIRHTDDPVAALSGGGHAAPVGAPGSIVVERSADPESGLHDIDLPAHSIGRYSETAAMVDASSDPRVGAVRDVFTELGSAESVRVFEYGATRDSALVTLAPGASPRVG